jgi:hypothetical protein
MSGVSRFSELESPDWHYSKSEGNMSVSDSFQYTHLINDRSFMRGFEPMTGIQAFGGLRGVASIDQWRHRWHEFPKGFLVNPVELKETIFVHKRRLGAEQFLNVTRGANAATTASE